MKQRKEEIEHGIDGEKENILESGKNMQMQEIRMYKYTERRGEIMRI